LKGIGPVVTNDPKAAAVRRGSQFLNSITDQSSVRPETPELEGRNGGGVTFGAQARQDSLEKKLSEASLKYEVNFGNNSSNADLIADLSPQNNQIFHVMFKPFEDKLDEASSKLLVGFGDTEIMKGSSKERMIDIAPRQF